ncbi:response regulator transcription factor [Malacoplasma muris]|uniref:response regulator transcription factor n=1 Tax=Malacoplasma muris TaxID=2119 RepID=UPI00398F6C0A
MKTNILFIYNVSKTLNGLKIELDDNTFIVEACNSSDKETVDKKIKNFRHDIVIIEVTNNIEYIINLIKEIRNKSILTDIITYGHNETLENILSLYKNGANDYIQAPIEPKILMFKIYSLSQKYEILNSKYFNNYVKYGDFVVDREANIIYLNNSQIEITKKEYRILRLLMKADGSPVNKQTLQKEIWGFVDESSKTVETTISALKKKLNNGYIKTIIKQGYFLDKNY